MCARVQASASVLGGRGGHEWPGSPLRTQRSRHGRGRMPGDCRFRGGAAEEQIRQ
jgi:hypothetical protein